MNHKYQAVKFLADAFSDQTLESSAGYDAAMMMVSHAQVHATLALVEQQRIANLIALADIKNPILSEQAATDAANALTEHHPNEYGGWFELKPDIAAALGIEQEGESK